MPVLSIYMKYNNVAKENFISTRQFSLVYLIKDENDLFLIWN